MSLSAAGGPHVHMLLLRYLTIMVIFHPMWLIAGHKPAFRIIAGYIYPATIILNKENEVDTSADVLDLEITINKDKFY